MEKDENKYLKISLDSYNNAIKVLNELQISAGIQNAMRLAQVGQFLSQVSIIEEEAKDGE